MATLQRRIERLESRAGTADDAPAIVRVLSDGMYRVGDEEMDAEEFARRYPDADVLRVTGFDNV